MILLAQFNSPFVSAFLYLCLGALIGWLYIAVKITTVEIAGHKYKISSVKGMAALALALIAILGAGALAIVIGTYDPNVSVSDLLAFLCAALFLPRFLRWAI